MPLYRITYTYDARRRDGHGFVSQQARGIFRAHGPIQAQVLCRIMVEADLGGRNVEITAVDTVTAPEEDQL